MEGIRTQERQVVVGVIFCLFLWRRKFQWKTLAVFGTCVCVRIDEHLWLTAFVHAYGKQACLRMCVCFPTAAKTWKASIVLVSLANPVLGAGCRNVLRIQKVELLGNAVDWPARSTCNRFLRYRPCAIASGMCNR